MYSEPKPRWILDFVFLALALCGFAINLRLLALRITDAAAGIAGCGGSCDDLLASRWAVLFGIPVAALGVAAYFALIASSTGHFRSIHRPLLGAILGAAGWFFFVQAVILKSFCPWCMAAHGVGIAAVASGIARLSGAHGGAVVMKSVGGWSIAAFLGIGLAQVYGPVPATHRIEGSPAVSRPAAVPVPGAGRIVFFDDGRKSYQVATMPRHGSAEARHIIVELFDYHCAACRTMAGFLDALVARHPADIAVLLLPVPLEQACNAHVPPGNQHPGACDTARIALAVWRVNPDAFPEFHRALIAEPSEATARRLAVAIMPPEELETALTDPWIDQLIRGNVADWRALSKSTEKLPKLLIRDRRILHGLPSGEADFIRVMEQELGL